MSLSTKMISVILIILFISKQGFGQKALFDTLKVDATTKIIGRYSRSDKKKVYKKYNFIIEDTAIIAKFIKKLKLGNEVFNSIEQPNFKLSVVKNYQELGFWTVNPTLQSAITHDGHTYEFDLNQINDLDKRFPFDYYYERKVFHKIEEYEHYLEKQKSNPYFLFDYAPQFKYEGIFEIEFKKSEKFSSPKSISEFLTPYIEQIVHKDQYRVVYSLNEKNNKDTKQFTMSISGPKELYEKLKIEGLKNENWKTTVEDGYFFYRK